MNYPKKPTISRFAIEGMEHGADAFVEKPFSIKYLQKQIENLLKLRLAFQETFVQSPSQIKLSGISNRDKEFMAQLHNEIERHVGKHDFSIDTLTYNFNPTL